MSNMWVVSSDCMGRFSHRGIIFLIEDEEIYYAMDKNDKTINFHKKQSIEDAEDALIAGSSGKKTFKGCVKRRNCKEVPR